MTEYQREVLWTMIFFVLVLIAAYFRWGTR